MNKQNKQVGFGAVGAVLVVAVIGILGFTGWYVWHVKNDVDKNQSVGSFAASAPATSKATVKADLKEYKNTDYKFSFKYPETWKLKDQLEPGRGKPEGLVTVTSPAGTSVEFNLNRGGKGGDCGDEQSPASARTTRTCNTLETLKLETFASGLAGRTFYLYQAKVTPPTEQGGKTFYRLGIKDNENSTPSVGTELTAVVIDIIHNNGGYINVAVSGKDDDKNASADFFNTNEVKEVTAILKTLQLAK